jgi:hypothetical protein
LNGAIANIASCLFYSLAHNKRVEQITKDVKTSKRENEASVLLSTSYCIKTGKMSSLADSKIVLNLF